MNNIVENNSKNTRCVTLNDKKLSLHSVPTDLHDATLSFFLTSAGCGQVVHDGSALQAVVDAVSDPCGVTEKVIISALVSTQNRSNRLYELGLQSSSIELIDTYLKYANKYANRVVSLTEAVVKIKNGHQQKIVVERINIENGAQVIVGNVSNAKSND